MPSPSSLHQELRFAHLQSGTRIAWATSGQGPVLLRAAHWMTHVQHDHESPIWRPWLERLGREVQLVRYDERGCGLSGPDDSPLGLEAAVEELDAVFAALGKSPVALLGMSGAVAPALVYAARHPQRVSHLLLLGGYTHGLLHRQPSAAKLALFEASAQLMEHGWGQRDAAVQQFFTAQMIPDASAEQARALNEQQRLSCSGARAAAILRARVALDVRQYLPQLRCPTLVMHCEGDGMVAVELGRELAAAIPDARFESLPSRNHIPLAGEPAFERFCGLVGDFVRDRSGAAAGLAFTPRERALLALVAQGLDNLQIAARLGLAEKTVRNGLSQLYASLGVEGRPQAVVRARELGFG